MGEEILGSEETTGGEAEADDSILTGDDADEKKDEGEAKEASSKEASEKKASEETDHKADDTDEKSKDGEADKGKDGAPEKYEDFNLPEGTEVDPETLDSLHEVLKEIGASQAEAQKLIDLQVKTMGQFAETQQKAWADTQMAWREAAENDDEYGKGKFDESTAIARKAMREIGGPELTKALNETGMGNHPEFIRAFYRMGKAIGEDSLSFGTANKEGTKSLADRIYPEQGKS